MYDIRLYDHNFNLLKILNLTGEHANVSSVNWKVMFNDAGMFELHFNKNDEDIIRVALENEVLIAVQERGADSGDALAAVIIGKQLARDGVLYGRTLNHLLTYRVINKFDGSASLKKAETIAREKVAAACDFITLGSVSGIADTVKFSRDTAESAFDVARDVLEMVGAGHKVTADVANKTFVFSVLKPKTNNNFVLSQNNNNAYDEEYLEDGQEYFTGGYYFNSGGVLTYYTPSNTLSGLLRRDRFFSGSDVERVKEELAKCAVRRESRIKTRGLLWGRDYQLGDTLKNQTAFGAARVVSQKVVGVRLWYEAHDIGEEPILLEV